MHLQLLIYAARIVCIGIRPFQTCSNSVAFPIKLYAILLQGRPICFNRASQHIALIVGCHSLDTTEALN